MLPVFHRLSRQPAMHELRRRLVAQRRVQPFSVVKHLDVFERRRLLVLACSKAGAMHPLVLEAVEPALGRGVIPAVTLEAHRAGHAIFGKLALERLAGVLAPLPQDDDLMAPGLELLKGKLFR